ncbi:hypothetical protein THTE_4303 [Thermogutta terrifontis]|uniref:Uncharacterized protein n=1 Tax=Thermogutta terrifontis TaxID=1331910 RepID=A0A286RLS0_9BACT|nr:hypothetical protein THTE_4303 [Thermogutta terrifontis]
MNLSPAGSFKGPDDAECGTRQVGPGNPAHGYPTLLRYFRQGELRKFR